MTQEETRADRKDRDNVATLGAGVFTNGVWDMLSVLVPLYAVAVGLSAAEIGLIIAARSVLPTLLSIHGGILMDELGTRRVLLWVAAASTALPLLFPLSSTFAVLSALQLFLGLASSLGMAASQTWSMQTSQGDTAILARYSVATRIGTFIGPVAVGATWDLLGAAAAFACVSLCGAGIIASTAYGTAVVAEPSAPRVRSNANVLMPRWEAHKQALLMALMPAVAFILAASFLRNAAGSIQSSLFIVYLSGIGLSGTLIGTLIGIAELAGVFGSLAASAAQRRWRTNALVLTCVVVSLVAICITPLIAHVFVLLVAAATMRGVAQGMSQPLMYSILSHEVPGSRHGASVGLRNTVIRLGSIITPAAMGFVAEAYGIDTSFYVIGAVFLLATAALAFAARVPR